ncbi:UDP-glycosyltransferase 708G1-like [Mangifera indica]|uniref:UDP-glycosyltransferase 708G1-like n=1 Tax=Mangifera indica TaxID=29780 RepID=UPI001CFA7DDB|nr:UDP-glycosyltransferase 708G1-like [Mangifera indica]
MADTNELGPLPSSHITLLPSSGMGHLTPFLRLAGLLASCNVKVTFITPEPPVSLAESQILCHFFSAFPQISQEKLHLLPLDNLSAGSEDDPFYCHIEVIRQSSQLLSSLLRSLSPPPSAIVTDMSLTAAVVPITEALKIPNFIFFTSSATMLILFVSFHILAGSMDGVKIPSLEATPRSWIPPPLLQDTNNLLKTYIIENGKAMTKSDGILVNTLDSIEQSSLLALNGGKVIKGLPSVTAIGLLPPCCFEDNQPLTWLDDQPAGSVVYVSFGSRTAISREQLRELGNGLVGCGYKFLWVVKDKKVDREDGEELVDVIGDELMESVKEKGVAVKHWVNQESILKHPAVGGFLSHCGWNSVTEAMWHGVRVLAWPQHGDQKINANLVTSIGLGIWEKSWGWGGEQIVMREQIAEKVRQMMGNEFLRSQAMRIREEAGNRIELHRSSKKGLTELIKMWKKE